MTKPSANNYLLDDLIDKLENGLNETKRHYEDWKVRNNASKTKAILFTKSTKMILLAQERKIQFCGSELK
jgi:hypothetical protein